MDSTPITTGPKWNLDTIGWDYFDVYVTKPVIERVDYVYPQIKHVIDSIWENHVTFYDLVTGADGYSIEFKREYSINAELRIYDEHGNYSSTDAKEIIIN